MNFGSVSTAGKNGEFQCRYQSVHFRVHLGENRVCVRKSGASCQLHTRIHNFSQAVEAHPLLESIMEPANPRSQHRNALQMSLGAATATTQRLAGDPTAGRGDHKQLALSNKMCAVKKHPCTPLRDSSLSAQSATGAKIIIQCRGGAILAVTNGRQGWCTIVVPA